MTDITSIERPKAEAQADRLLREVSTGVPFLNLREKIVTALLEAKADTLMDRVPHASSDYSAAPYHEELRQEVIGRRMRGL